MQGKCTHHDICGLFTKREDGYCILHSPDLSKDREWFRKEFNNHIRTKGYKCDKFIFPIELNFTISDIEGGNFETEVSFKEAVFTKKVVFDSCAFLENTTFENAIFEDTAFFHGALFNSKAVFIGTKFLGQTDFGESDFRGNADFLLSKFYKRVEFFATKFNKSAEFRDSIFHEGARFLETKFLGEDALFSFSSFLAPTYFSRGREKEMIFENTKVYFEEVTIHPNDVLSFKNADLSKAVFRGTDCRNLDFSGVKWASYQGRTAVYDEVLLNDDSEEIIRYDTIEELYRQLKQNYADKRDYVSAGDFHYGEKETVRNNSKTFVSLKFLLNIYKYVSGYGERIRPPVIWLFVILFVSSFLYYIGGIEFSKDYMFTNSHIQVADYLLNSIEVMFFLGGKTYISSSYLSSIAVLVQSIVSPIVLALLALAIRQKLKR